MKKSGFTLAEVLITLAIIGVVAALTIPAVVTNYRETQYKTQFKKAYNTILSAINKVYYDWGTMPQCYVDAEKGVYNYVNSECEKFYEDLRKNLKIIKYCNSALNEGCVPAYTLTTESLGGCARNGFSPEEINRRPAWVLPDGMVMFSYWGTHPMIGIDINGKKAPNKWGHDVFAVDIHYRNKKFELTDKTCGEQMVQDGGRKFSDMLKWVYK